jgi:ferritin-like metal-binding protein YciE
MPIHEPLDLFLHDLGAMYDAEQCMTTMLPVLASECSDSQVQASLEHHLQETQQQIKNLEECFREVGTQLHPQDSAAMRGIKREHDVLLQESPPSDLLQIFDMGSAAKTEAYEIVSYQGLIGKAADLGQSACVELLRANLMQEQAMLARLQQLARQIGQRQRPAATPMDQPERTADVIDPTPNPDVVPGPDSVPPPEPVPSPHPVPDPEPNPDPIPLPQPTPSPDPMPKPPPTPRIAGPG